MAKNALPVVEWLANAESHGIADRHQIQVMDQLKNFDASNTGVGFVFVVQSIVNDADDNDQMDEIISCPVIKVCGQWYVVTEDIGDITAAVIRTIVRDVSNK